MLHTTRTVRVLCMLHVQPVYAYISDLELNCSGRSSEFYLLSLFIF